MRFLNNLPTIVILGLLAIFYGAIFINAQSILSFASKNLPLFLGYGIFLFMMIIPIGIKGGLLFYRGKRDALKKVLYFSAIVLSIFGFLIYFSTDLSKLWLNFMQSQLLKEFHKPIIGFISIATSYLFFFLLIGIVKVEDFLESIRNLKFITPVFCFGLPAFWKKSLLGLNLTLEEITFVNSISILTGIIFLLAIIIYFVAKHYNMEREDFGLKKLEYNRKVLYQTSLAFFFLGLAFLLFIIIDLSYLISI